MNLVVLHLGSNKGEKAKNILSAYNLIEERIGHITKKSSLHHTKAWGIESQDDFLNSALIVETDLGPFEVLTISNQIEKDLGRKKTEKWGPRIIDIDIIFYNNLVLKSSMLTIPHPFYHLREFVISPLKELDILVD